MKKYLKFASVIFGVIATALMAGAQAVIEWFSGKQDTLYFNALVGGKYSSDFNPGVKFDAAGNGSGLAGYILVGVGTIIVLLTVLIPLFKEHDVLSAVVTGIGVICMIVGTVLIFLIRKSIDDATVCKTVYVGWGAIAAGSCASLAAASGALGVVFDIAGN